MTALLQSAFLLVALVVSPSIQVCAPDCTGVDPGTKVRDPTDCTKYYVCIDASGTGELVPSSESVSCPDDQYFNPAHTMPRCDPIAGAPSDFCTPLCNPCVPHCNHPGEVTPHPQNCSTFHVCLNDNHILDAGCPAELPYFDFLIGACQGDETMCYHYCDPCVPHCTQQDERVPDPTDCHKFYLCTPPTMSSFLCPHGQVFNADTRVCEDNAECSISCPGNKHVQWTW